MLIYKTHLEKIFNSKWEITSRFVWVVFFTSMSLNLFFMFEIDSIVNTSAKAHEKELSPKESASTEPMKFSMVHPCGRDWCSNETVLLVTGKINPSEDVNFKKNLAPFLNANGSKNTIRTICINSPGGNTSSAIEIMNIISENKLNTCVANHYETLEKKIASSEDNTRCNSMCPWLLSAGVRRISFGKDVSVLFHGTFNTDEKTSVETPAPQSESKIQSAIVKIANRNSKYPIEKIKNLISWSFQQGYGAKYGTRLGITKLVGSGLISEVYEDNATKYVNPVAINIAGVNPQ